MYIEAKKQIIPALVDFRNDVNDLLPDNDGSYYIPWEIEDCHYVQECMDKAIGVVLSTVMANHNSYELTEVKNRYAAAFKEKNIPGCQAALNDAMITFQAIFIALKAIK